MFTERASDGSDFDPTRTSFLVRPGSLKVLVKSSEDVTDHTEKAYRTNYPFR